MTLDRYDVEAMIRDAPEVAALRRDVQDLTRELDYLRMELRREVQDLHDADDATTRVLNARTEGLV